jgi:crossover junction endonuclease MUS81
MGKQLKLVVVPGESKLIEELVKMNVAFTTEPLDVGDVHIRTEDGNVEMVIERKEGKDLEASIKDGRYKEQKERMKALVSVTFPRHRIVYLIENMPKTSSLKKSLWSSVTNMQYRDGFTVFQSKNVSESVDYIVSMMNTIATQQEMSEDGSVATSSTSNLKITETQIKKRKVCPEDFFLNTLMLIPGVNEVATSVVEKYPTISTLQEAFKSSPAPSMILKDLERPSGKMKIGKVLSERIFTFFSKQ